jgi:uncharacterized cupredoxin-like copper-binding protein
MKTLLAILLAVPLLAQQGPAPVTDAVRKAYPNSKITAVKKETEKGQTVYEVETKDGKISRDFMVKPDGTILESEESMELSVLPKPVVDAVKTQHPKAVITGAEKVTRGAEVLYELALKEGNKKSELSVNAAGQIQK